MEFITGFIVGVVVAGLIGRAKFAQVQAQLRQTRDNFMETLSQLEKERDLSYGLSLELADRTR